MKFDKRNSTSLQIKLHIYFKLSTKIFIIKWTSHFHRNHTVIIYYILIKIVKHSLCFEWRNWWNLYPPRPDKVAPMQCCAWRKVPKEHLDWINRNISMYLSQTTPTVENKSYAQTTKLETVNLLRKDKLENSQLKKFLTHFLEGFLS